MIVACVCRRGLGRFEERLADSAKAQLAEIEAELESEGLVVDYREALLAEPADAAAAG